MFGYKKEQADSQLKEQKQRAERLNDLEKSFKRGIGSLLHAEYKSPLLTYLYVMKPKSITLVSAVEPITSPSKEITGIWYGIKVMDKQNEIFRIPTFSSRDACFFSTLASWRRNNHLLLATLLCQYLKSVLEYDLYECDMKCQIVLAEDIQINEKLLGKQKIADDMAVKTELEV